MRVTDESIAKVPRIESNVLDERHWDTLQKESMDLLDSVRDMELGTERIITFDLSMRKLGEAVGLPGDHRVEIRNFPEQHVLIHNHADSDTFSPSDFRSLIERPNTLSIQAVGHDGSMFVLDKLPSYDAAGAVHKFNSTMIRVEASMRQCAEKHEIVNAIEQFYHSLSEHGFVYRRWR